ncbi:diacylglycerol kinase family lipid kinase [Thermoleophilia bacterium SCSIO 60948]|nr:diacylglycerol kinase family lipid kinase [Thermoleophilia bacterium SCSIO 60948]
MTSVPPAELETRPSERDDAAPPSQKKRMLIVVNPFARTVSNRLKNLVVYALQSRYEVEAITTEAQNHATEISREAKAEGHDIVVAFGGDGTLNEVVNGIAGTDIAFSVLPGGSTNVVARTLGIPNDVVDATEHLLALADDFEPRPIDLGVANGRRFLFSCGAGLDATAAQMVDSRPEMKRRGGRWFYASAAIGGFYRRYLTNPVRMRLRTGDTEVEGITALCQNSDPFTFFGERSIRVCEDVTIDSGTLSIAMLKRAAQRDVPLIMARIFNDSMSAGDHRQIEHLSGITAATVTSVSRDENGDARAFPVQLDGEYVGHHKELELAIEPGALRVVA